jgi:hypothetical protein
MEQNLGRRRGPIRSAPWISARPFHPAPFSGCAIDQHKIGFMQNRCATAGALVNRVVHLHRHLGLTWKISRLFFHQFWTIIFFVQSLRKPRS